jgi:D-galactarolactone cycloisomerase
MVNRVIAPALVGRPLDRPSAMLDIIKVYFAALGHTKGPAMEAVSGVDIALWDLTARRDGKTLAAYLGATLRPVPTYVSPVPFLPTPKASADAAVRLAEGFSALKLKVGRAGLEDIPHIAAVRDAVGPDIQLMLDANCGYALEQAKMLVREIAPFDIAWLEEPLPPDDIADLRALSEVTPIPLAGGENEFTPRAFSDLITRGCVTIIQPNVARAGGISGFLELDAVAQRYGAVVAPHGVGGSVAMAATLHVASAMQAFSLFEMNRLPNPLRDAFGQPLLVGLDGMVSPPGGPGHGCPIEGTDLQPYVDASMRVA